MPKFGFFFNFLSFAESKFRSLSSIIYLALIKWFLKCCICHVKQTRIFFFPPLFCIGPLYDIKLLWDNLGQQSIPDILWHLLPFLVSRLLWNSRIFLPDLSWNQPFCLSEQPLGSALGISVWIRGFVTKRFVTCLLPCPHSECQLTLFLRDPCPWNCWVAILQLRTAAILTLPRIQGSRRTSSFPGSLRVVGFCCCCLFPWMALQERVSLHVISGLFSLAVTYLLVQSLGFPFLWQMHSFAASLSRWIGKSTLMRNLN